MYSANAFDSRLGRDRYRLVQVLQNLKKEWIKMENDPACGTLWNDLQECRTIQNKHHATTSAHWVTYSGPLSSV